MELVEKFMDVSTIRLRLEKEGALQCTYCVQSDIGTVQYKKARIFYFDESKEEILYIQRDITELYMEEQKKKEALQTTINKEFTANQAKNEFLKNTSYNLRTPLEAMHELIELTFDDVKNTKLVRENMEKMREISTYTLRLVEDVLQASQMTNLTSKLHLEPYSYQEFSKALKTMFLAQYAKKGVTLSINKPKDSPIIMADKLQVNQIAYQLLGNALKRTPSGRKVAFTIKNLKIRDETVWFDFVISDDGIGELSETEDIGMSVIRNLVNLMDGTISIDRKPEKGTTVTVHFSFEKAQ